MTTIHGEPTDAIPEVDGTDYGEHEFYYRRILSIVKLIESKYSVSLSKSDGEWVLVAMEEYPEDSDQEIADAYTEEFPMEESQRCDGGDGNDPHDYASGWNRFL